MAISGRTSTRETPVYVACQGCVGVNWDVPVYVACGGFAGASFNRGYPSVRSLEMLIPSG
ncbi:hypothetical protein CDL15_Pgr026212 [Punica granatum]|uniref:Uncharacterized protein n=1 Tax=Punica granatum TaxID=22663 RepID=A0A218VS62_PUNGR|nr:hypothetical protein CDL15_Pgr026212 [Punica granatum]